MSGGNNGNLMESILAHLRKLILLTELGDEEKLNKLVNMSCEVSNQLIRIENGELNNKVDYLDQDVDSDNCDLDSDDSE